MCILCERSNHVNGLRLVKVIFKDPATLSWLRPPLRPHCIRNWWSLMEARGTGKKFKFKELIAGKVAQM
jgi:hypothetical protein